MALKLSAGDPAREAVNHGHVALAMGGEVVEIDLTVPEGKVSVERLLPILQGLTNFIVDRAEAREASEGRHVTCAKGCGACCRQIVPVSQAEARALGRLVAAMPEPRRAHVRQRFQDALAALEAQGLTPRDVTPMLKLRVAGCVPAGCAEAAGEAIITGAGAPHAALTLSLLPAPCAD